MPNPPSAINRLPVRIALTISFSIGLILFAVVAMPPSSRAIGGYASASDAGRKRSRPEFVPGEVLVRYQSESVAKGQSRATTIQNAEGQSLVIHLERFEGSEIVSGLRIARVAPEDTLKAIEALRQQPAVLYAEPNYLLFPDTTTPNDPSFAQLYGIAKIGAPQAWDTTQGSTNVVIGVIDEGIDISHQDLQPNIWTNPAPGSIPGISGDLHGYDFANNSGTISADDHGSHVAGTIGAKGDNGIGVVGVNWNVGLMSLKFISGPSGSTSNAIRACNYAKQMRDLWISSSGTKGANIRVLNNSYGGGGFTQAFLDAINALNQSEILFVAAAGNVGTDTPERDNEIVPHYPSSYNAPNVVAVAATDQNDNLALFSHYGLSSVQIGAPGVSILSTTPNNTFGFKSGTSMATPHVAGAAALLLAQNPSLTVQQLKDLLLFNGDVTSALVDKTVTGRRLNVSNSLQALAENDVTPPGMATNLHVASQTGRSMNLGWTTSGDDGASGQASLYQLTFADPATGVVIPLKNVIPASSGSPQTLDVKIPYRHTSGTITLREFDNVGNEGLPASLNVSIPLADGDPYRPTLGAPVALSTGGTLISDLAVDDGYHTNYPLPFAFPFFGQAFSDVTISSNGTLYFSTPPNGPSADALSSSADLSKFKMIAGLWDDLDLRTSSRSDAGLYVVQPDANRAIFRWQGVPCNDLGSGCTGGAPVNFEIELRNDGTIRIRYGAGNTSLFPVVGISAGEPEAYVIATHTSELTSISLTNAQEVTFLTPGYEGDVAPRPNGSNDGTVSIADWVQIGRFAAALDTPDPGSEFQRTDCAPKGSLGNGSITIADWVQAGRYAAGLDPIVSAGGPTSPPSDSANQAESRTNAGESSTIAAARMIRVTGSAFNAGQPASVTIELDSQGDENALGFSVTFNSSQLTFVSATIGSDASGAQLNVNNANAAAGRVGIAMALPSGQAFAAGTRQLVVLNFTVAVNASGSSVISFADQPIGRDVVDMIAVEFAATYRPATLNITSTPTPTPTPTPHPNGYTACQQRAVLPAAV